MNQSDSTVRLPAPSLLRVAAANLAGFLSMILTGAGILALTFFGPYWNPLLQLAVGGDTFWLFAILLWALVLFVFALVEWLWMRRWIARPRLWTLGSMILLFGMLYVSAVLYQQAFTPAMDRYRTMVLYHMIPAIPDTDSSMLVWIIVSGSSVGLACGLVFALIQSLMLESGRRRWWIITTIVWMLLCALMALLLFTLATVD